MIEATITVEHGEVRIADRVLAIRDVLVRGLGRLGGEFIGVGETFETKTGHALPLGGCVSIPPNHAHYAWAGGQETVVQVHGFGPTDLRFVNPADDPRTKK